MNASLPEAVRTDLTIRRDLRADDLRGFLGDLWREPDGHDAALVFADWLEDQGDARTQPVRWSILRENGYTESVRTAYRERMTEWWLRHGRSWVGPVPHNQRLIWWRGCLSTTVQLALGRSSNFTSAIQTLQTVRQAPWLTRIELVDATMTGAFHELGPNLQALALTRSHTADLTALERVPNLRHLSLTDYAPPSLELRNLPALQVVEQINDRRMAQVTLRNLPQLIRFESFACPLVEEVRVEAAPRLTSLSLGAISEVRRLHLLDLPALENLDVPPGPIELHVKDCPRLPRAVVAAIVARRRR